MSDDYVYQLSISIPHSGSDYSKADMVNIRGRNPDEFHRALTAFDQHMTTQAVAIGKSLRAQALLAGELDTTHVSTSQNPQNAAQGSQSAPVDPWTGQPANGAQNDSQGFSGQQQQSAPQGGGVPTQPPPHVGPAPSCSHGVKRFIAKAYKNGKPGYWMAWACPAQRGDTSQHDLEFIRTD